MTMELREFAERVLFATTLDGKLSCPATITDERPGAALDAPAMPGRPAELRFKDQRTGKAGFPASDSSIDVHRNPLYLSHSGIQSVPDRKSVV